MSAIDSDQFKQGMRHLAAGVTMVTTSDCGERYGLVATAVCSVCADPPTLLVCINRGAGTHQRIANSGRFCVNVVDRGQADLVKRFLATEHSRRFEICAWTTLRTGAPVLESALVSFDCEVVQSATAGTHTVFFGRIVAARVAADRAPLVYYNGDYATVAPLELAPAG